MPSQPPADGVEAGLERLRRHRLMPRLVETSRGPVAGGLPLQIPVRAYLDSSAAASALHEHLQPCLDWQIPVTLALTNIDQNSRGADTSDTLEAFCRALRAALSPQAAGSGLIGLSIRSHLLPLQAYLVITSTLGAGPRYVMLDSLQMLHHADRRVQAVTEANWIELWHRREQQRGARAVYAESVRSLCPLLSDEKSSSILPVFGMPVPAESAWLPVELYLPNFSDGHGHLDLPAMAAALNACLETSELLAEQLCWASAAQGVDASTNNRLALLLSGIGDLVIERRMEPTAIHCLRWVDTIVRAVQRKLWDRSREMARDRATLPSLLQSDPSNVWHNTQQQHDWSHRWGQTLQNEAVRHRNLLVLSPYSVLPRAGICSPAFTDLLPVLAHADAIGFTNPPPLANWNVNEFSRFHRRAWAVIMRESTRSRIAAQA
jgi:hypothetical protein